jgi:hypothetical protein
VGEFGNISGGDDTISGDMIKANTFTGGDLSGDAITCDTITANQFVGDLSGGNIKANNIQIGSCNIKNIIAFKEYIGEGAYNNISGDGYDVTPYDASGYVEIILSDVNFDKTVVYVTIKPDRHGVSGFKLAYNAQLVYQTDSVIYRIVKYEDSENKCYMDNNIPSHTLYFTAIESS